MDEDGVLAILERHRASMAGHPAFGEALIESRRRPDSGRECSLRATYAGMVHDTGLVLEEHWRRVAVAIHRETRLRVDVETDANVLPISGRFAWGTTGHITVYLDLPVEMETEDVLRARVGGS